MEDFSRNLGDPVVDQFEKPMVCGYKRTGLSRNLRCERANKQKRIGAVKRIKISDTVFATGSLSAFVVLMTPGNAVQADPVEERGASLLLILNLQNRN